MVLHGVDDGVAWCCMVLHCTDDGVASWWCEGMSRCGLRPLNQTRLLGSNVAGQSRGSAGGLHSCTGYREALHAVGGSACTGCCMERQLWQCLAAGWTPSGQPRQWALHSSGSPCGRKIGSTGDPAAMRNVQQLCTWVDQWVGSAQHAPAYTAAPSKECGALHRAAAGMAAHLL